jgi:hypothetical protein
MSKQIIKSVLCLLVAVLTVSIVSPSALAQLPPPVSPWMGMFDRPTSPTLGNFLGNVRPQQDLMRAATAHVNQMQAQQRALQALQTPQGGLGAGGAGGRNLAGPAGGGSSAQYVLAPPRVIPRAQRSPAGFNQYLHYYPSHSMPRRPVPNFSSTGRRR